MLGLRNTVVSFIRSQRDPKKPVGTIINTNSGLAGVIDPGVSALHCEDSRASVHGVRWSRSVHVKKIVLNAPCSSNQNTQHSAPLLCSQAS